MLQPAAPGPSDPGRVTCYDHRKWSAAAALTDLGITKAPKLGTYATLPLGVTGVGNLSGDNRYFTNLNVANWAKDNAGLTFARLGIATGDKFPDALASGPYLAQNGGLLLLTRPSLVPTTISETMLANGPEVQRISFIGIAPTTIWQLFLFLPVGSPPSTPNLSVGSHGDAVLWLEKKLAALTYQPGLVDGVYDKKTYHAMIAFQKWEGLGRDGNVTATDRAKLLIGSPPTASRSGTMAWLEVDKTHQLLLSVQEGFVVKTLPCSTGSSTVTPSGNFAIYARFSGWWGGVYDACDFKPLPYGGSVSIHGYDNVPTYPASHGCVRVNVWDMAELFPQVGIGTAVFVY